MKAPKHKKLTSKEYHARWASVISYLTVYCSLRDAEKMVAEHKKIKGNE